MTNVDLNLGDTQLILSYCQTKGLLRNQTAYVLATGYWESGHTMLPVEEAYYLQAKYNWTPERMDRWRRDNLRYYPWHGRGYTQTTWERNYQKLKLATGVDVISKPEKAMEPEVAVVALVDGIMEGWWTGKKLTDYVTLQRSDYVGARRCVNGTDKAHAIAELAREYEAALLAIGYGVEEAPTPVVNSRRDGSEPRESLTESTTLRAVLAAALATVGQVWDDAKSLVGSVSRELGVSPEVAFALIAAAALAWIYRERLRKWAQGDR